MAKLVVCAALSHTPQLLTPPEDWLDMPHRTKLPLQHRPQLERALTLDARRENYRRCHDAMKKIGQLLEEAAPDVVLVIGDDQHENFFDDNMPAFGIYMADNVLVSRRMRNTGETALQQAVLYPVRADLAENLLHGLMAADFDPAWLTSTRSEAGLGHAFGRALYLVSLNPQTAILPVMVNTYYPPAPSAARCLRFGRAIGAVIRAWPAELRVAVLISGGLSHTRLDEELDRALIRALETNDQDYLAALPSDQLIEGTSEVRNWVIAGGIVDAPAKLIDYIPCYRSMHGVGCGMGFMQWPSA